MHGRFEHDLANPGCLTVELLLRLREKLWMLDLRYRAFLELKEYFLHGLGQDGLKKLHERLFVLFITLIIDNVDFSDWFDQHGSLKIGRLEGSVLFLAVSCESHRCPV